MTRIISFLILILFIVPLYSQVSEEEELYLWLNQIREDKELKPLEKENILSVSSHKYGLELMERGYLTHRDRESKGPLERYTLLGGTAMGVGEILGTKNQAQPLSLLKKMWLESETHRAQILNPKWTTVGLAKIENEGIDIYVIQFANSLLIDFEIVKKDEIVTLFFTPLHLCESLYFYDVFERKEYLWKRGEEGKMLIDNKNSFLLLEVYKEERNSLSNRILIY
jgi:hypothetical protein